MLNTWSWNDDRFRDDVMTPGNDFRITDRTIDDFLVWTRKTFPGNSLVSVDFFLP